jgi:hypothetical protein
MTDLIRKILAEIPDRSERSSLDPYRDLVLEMRRRGYSYREMAQLLADRCEVKISHAAIHNFVRRQARGLAAEQAQARPASGVGRATGAFPVEMGGVRDRIAALRSRPTPSQVAEESEFRFDPDQPLRLGDKEH